MSEDAVSGHIQVGHRSPLKLTKEGQRRMQCGPAGPFHVELWPQGKQPCYHTVPSPHTSVCRPHGPHLLQVVAPGETACFACVPPLVVASGGSGPVRCRRAMTGSMQTQLGGT